MSTESFPIAILGGGTMGLGIAHASAVAGYPSRLFDIAPAQLERARRAIGKNLQRGVERGKLSAEDAASAVSRLSFSSDLEVAVLDCGLVIEAVPESMPLKVELFQKVATCTAPETILASNTSGLSITEMAAASGRPDRFAGMHFFNPVHAMKLVEIIRGLESSEETLDSIRRVAERMGKETVLVHESPGFVTSRINALIGNEAFRMLETGVASAEDIDKALKLGLNHPMGPFEMVDLVGLDIRLSILQFLHQTLGDTYRPTNLMIRYVRAGRLGRKVGRGVYRYDDEGRRLEDTL